MELWKVKRESLKLMSADSDIEYTEDDFSSGTIYSNPNVKDKLVLMESSIRRAIDFYYNEIGTPKGISTVYLKYHFEDEDGNEVTVTEETDTTDLTKVYENEIETTGITNFGDPFRIDAKVYNDYGELVDEEQSTNFQYVYDFDLNKKRIIFDDNFKIYEDKIRFIVWFESERLNIPFVFETGVTEINYDLDTLRLPIEFQRLIPLYVKSELYEEDEPDLAVLARSQFLQGLSILPKNRINMQNKIRRAKIFNK